MAAAAPGSRWRPLKIAGALAALAIASIAGTNAWAAYAARARRYTTLDAIPSRSVAIVPGSRVHKGQPLRILRDRLEKAQALYEEGRVRAILVSGQDSEAAPEVTVMRAWLRDHGVPVADIWTDERGWRTRDTMEHAAAVYRVTDAVVCTQNLNMPRSLWLARAAGMDVVGAEVPSHLAGIPHFEVEEALKTTLALAESVFRGHAAAPRRGRPTIATR